MSPRRGGVRFPFRLPFGAVLAPVLRGSTPTTTPDTATRSQKSLVLFNTLPVGDKKSVVIFRAGQTEGPAPSNPDPPATGEPSPSGKPSVNGPPVPL